jgi:hypothetical protein
MRTLLRVICDVKASNQAIIDGTLSKVFQDTIEKLQPEASYFLAQDGSRSCIIVFDLKDPSDIPVIAENFFLTMNAKVEFSPVMNADDLARGLSKWEQSSQFIPEKFHQGHTN